MIREPDDRIVIRHINPFRIVARRVKGNAERPIQPFREDLVLRGRIRSVRRAQHANPVATGFGDEDVAVRRRAGEARVAESFGKFLHRETLRHRQRRPLGRAHHPGVVAGRGRGEGGRQLFLDEIVFAPRSLPLPIVRVSATANGLNDLIIEGHPFRDLQRREKSDHIRAIGRIGHRHGHEGAGHRGQRVHQELVQRRGIPSDAEISQRLRVIKVRAGSGLSSNHTHQAWPLLGNHRVVGSQLRCMADGTANLKVSPPARSIAGG